MEPLSTTIARYPSGSRPENPRQGARLVEAREHDVHPVTVDRRARVHRVHRVTAVGARSVANSAMPSTKGTAGVQPSSARSRAELAVTCRTSPSRNAPVTTGAGPSRAADNAEAMSATVRGVPAADVERAQLAGRKSVRHKGGEPGCGDVADVHEVTALTAVLVHLRGVAAQQGRAEESGDARVRGVDRHPRSVHVVVPQGRNGGTGTAGPGSGEELLRRLRRGVDVARVQSRVLGHELGLEGGAAGRAGWLEPTQLEVGLAAWWGGYSAMLGAAVGALAVDDHRRGEHQPGRSASRHRGEQHRCSQVVVADVRRQVLQVDTESHHGGLVADGVDPGERGVAGGGVADVALDELRAEGQVDGRCTVEHADVVPGGEQRLRDVGAHEPCSAGHEYAHPATLATSGLGHLLRTACDLVCQEFVSSFSARAGRAAPSVINHDLGSRRVRRSVAAQGLLAPRRA